MTLLLEDNPTITGTTVADVLELATKKIEDNWCQGEGANDTYENGMIVKTAHCMIGATSRAARELLAPYGVVNAALELIRKAIRGPHIIVYNDAPERLHAEVVGKMHEALELARGL